MSPSETVLQAVRAWIKGALDLTDKQVIAANAGGPRPPMPYLAVNVTTPAAREGGWDEQVASIEDDEPTLHVAGRRRASVSVHGFGGDTEAWLQELTLAAAHAPEDGGYAFEVDGSISNDTLPRDTSMEPRFLLELQVPFGIEGAKRTVQPLQHATVQRPVEGDTITISASA